MAASNSLCLDSLVNNPGLSHLASKIFLNLDLESFGRLELVCKAWRSHVIENRLWRQKLATLDTDHTEDTADKEELHRKCKSLCRNIAVRNRWLDPNVKVRVKKSFEVPGHWIIGEYAIFQDEKEGQERLAYVRDSALHIVKGHPSGEEKKVNNDLGLKIGEGYLDVRGDHVAMGTSRETVAICNWRTGQWLLPDEAEDSGQGWLFGVMFTPDGTSVVSCNQEGTISVWSFSGEKLELAQTIEDRCHGRLPWPSIDMSNDHVILACGGSLHIYALADNGTYVETGRCEVSFITRSGLEGIRALRCSPYAIAWNEVEVKFWDVRDPCGGHQGLGGALFRYLPIGRDSEDAHVKQVAECPHTGMLAVGLAHRGSDLFSVVVMPVPSAARPLPRRVWVPAARVELPRPVDRVGLKASPANPGVFHVTYQFGGTRKDLVLNLRPGGFGDLEKKVCRERLVSLPCQFGSELFHRYLY